MKKITLMTLFCCLALFNIQVLADEIKEAEISSQQLKLSKDGTGIIKLRDCDKDGCKNMLVKVTQATKGVLNGVEMNLLRAKSLSRPGFVGLLYSRETKEALSIGFTQ